MNNYPAWWNQSVTVFNKYEDPTTRRITWYKQVLSGCFWKYTENELKIGETVLQSAVTLCRVPVNALFKERYEWEQSTEAERGEYFTFGPGDILVKGEVDEVIDEYTTGRRSSDLLTKYRKLQGCMVVQKCATNTGDGRGQEHYLIKGV